MAAVSRNPPSARPACMPLLRCSQFFLAFAIACLVAHLLSIGDVAIPIILFMAAASVTCFTSLYVFAAENFIQSSYNFWIVIVLEVLLLGFWLGVSARLIHWVVGAGSHILHCDDDDRLKIKRVCHNSNSGRFRRDMLVATCLFGGLESLLFAISLLCTVLSTHRHCLAGGHHQSSPTSSPASTPSTPSTPQESKPGHVIVREKPSFASTTTEPIVDDGPGPVPQNQAAPTVTITATPESNPPSCVAIYV